jgi:hypothetical protein
MQNNCDLSTSITSDAFMSHQQLFQRQALITVHSDCAKILEDWSLFFQDKDTLT